MNDSELQNEVDRLMLLRGDDNWKDVRAPDNFERIVRKYNFGERICFQRKDDASYEDLQSSRGISAQQQDIERMLAQIGDDMTIIESDRVRIDEIDAIFVQLVKTGFNIKHTGFAELGFRIPRLMKYYADMLDVPVFGYDISPLSIGVTQHLGYDARHYDFDRCDDELDLQGASLVVSYHMLEHVSDPQVAVNTIFDAMDYGAFFHVEIPIEPGLPRLQFAHMFPFEMHDMLHMLTNAGFVVITRSTATHTNGPLVERYMAMKR